MSKYGNSKSTYPNEHTEEKLINFVGKIFVHESGTKCYYGVEDNNFNTSKSNMTLDEFKKIQNGESIVRFSKTKNADYNWRPMSINNTNTIECSAEAIGNMYILDIDNFETGEDGLKYGNFHFETLPELFKNCPYTKSRNKQNPHLFFKINGVDSSLLKTNGWKNASDNLNFAQGELLTRMSWEYKTEKIYNWVGIDVPTLEWNDVKKYLKKEEVAKWEKKCNIINSMIKNTETEEETDTESIISNSTTYSVTNINQNNREITVDEMMVHADNIDMEYIESGAYTNWRDLIWSLRSAGNKLYLNVAKHLAGRCGRDISTYVDTFWENYNSSKGITIATFLGRSKKSNKDKFYEIIKNHTKETDTVISWVLSEAEFARKLKEIVFKNKNIVFTGMEKLSEGYMFNDIYWEKLSFHDGELVKKIDQLFDWYSKKLNLAKSTFDDKIYKELYNQINKLNNYTYRHNVVKMFKAYNYVKNIEWNKNNDLFMFEDCAYDLKTNSWIESTDPDDYMNTTCGYKYRDSITTNLDTEMTEITTFLKDIVHQSDYEFFLNKMSSFLKKENKEELGYFWLGAGRNGKGTATELLRVALGSYWGELNMSYYIDQDHGSDKPNQNLFNCRNASVLNSCEVENDNGFGKTVKFISSNFKKLTGRDSNYAREIGTKTTTYFEAGKVLIQTNNMPTFTKIDTALKERICVMEFPHIYTSNEDLITENPEIYKMKDTSLKDKFKQEKYKLAFIRILLENYPKYQKQFNIPDNVRKFTNKYFASESIEGWITKNCIQQESSCIDLEHLKGIFNTDTGKTLSVRQLREELEYLKFNVTQRKLKGYSFKE